MKDATAYILSEIRRVLLAANLGVPVFSLERPPSSNDKRFVLVSSSYSLPGRNKDHFTKVLSVYVNAVDKRTDSSLSEKDVALLSDKVVAALTPAVNQSPFNDNADFNIYDVEVTNIMPFKDRVDDGVVLTRQCEIEFSILIK